MRQKTKYLSLFIFLALATGVCRAQQIDPYANSYRQQQMEHYNERLTKFIGSLKTLYFASACKVFKTAIGVNAITITLATHFQLMMPQEQFVPIEKDAKASGLARASAEGCDYWHQHPEKVYELRQLEWNAIQNLR